MDGKFSDQYNELERIWPFQEARVSYPNRSNRLTAKIRLGSEPGTVKVDFIKSGWQSIQCSVKEFYESLDPSYAGSADAKEGVDSAASEVVEIVKRAENDECARINVRNFLIDNFQ